MPDWSLIAAGGTLCGIGLVSWLTENKRHRAHVSWCSTASITEGVVSRTGKRGYLSRNKPTSDDEYSVVSIVRFRAPNGVEYEIDAPDAPRTLGQSVKVAYDPALPSSARAVDRTKKIGCAVVFLAAGLALIGAGVRA